jgi:hypothetical protein
MWRRTRLRGRRHAVVDRKKFLRDISTEEAPIGDRPTVVDGHQLHGAREAVFEWHPSEWRAL